MKKLYKSRDNRVMAGVLGGVGEYLDIDPTIIRFGFLFALFVTAVVPLTLFYFSALLIMPEHAGGAVKDV
jgi:phage shock protein C